MKILLYLQCSAEWKLTKGGKSLQVYGTLPVLHLYGYTFSHGIDGELSYTRLSFIYTPITRCHQGHFDADHRKIAH